jgi:hypothetical protein
LNCEHVINLHSFAPDLFHTYYGWLELFDWLSGSCEYHVYVPMANPSSNFNQKLFLLINEKKLSFIFGHCHPLFFNFPFFFRTDPFLFGFFFKPFFFSLFFFGLVFFPNRKIFFFHYFPSRFGSGNQIDNAGHGRHRFFFFLFFNTFFLLIIFFSFLRLLGSEQDRVIGLDATVLR